MDVAIIELDFSNIRLHCQRMTRPVPTYDLYGESLPRGRPAAPEFLLHCEEIYERSRVHGWEIRPHRHDHYFQILYIAAGEAELSDGVAHRVLELPCIIRVPAGCIHGFRFSHDVDGYVLTMARSRLGLLLGPDAPAMLDGSTARAMRLPAGGNDRRLLDVVQALRAVPAEYAGRQPGHSAAVEALAVRALVAVDRADPMHDEAQSGAGSDPRLVRLDRLIDLHFREHRPVSFYAGALGVSPTHLNRLLREARGTTVRKLLAERLIDEAKRGLLFGVQSVKATALALGFADTAYFTRFFRRETGMRPSYYRETRQDRRTGSRARPSKEGEPGTT